jgi:hypothetical protein
VHEIIGPLVRLKAPELMMFTRMTGDVVKAMRVPARSPSWRPSTACAPAPAPSWRWRRTCAGHGTQQDRLPVQPRGPGGLRHGRLCAMLPRIIGQGRASELLYTGAVMDGERGERWGWLNRLVHPTAWPPKPRDWPRSWPPAPPLPTA